MSGTSGSRSGVVVISEIGFVLLLFYQYLRMTSSTDLTRPVWYILYQYAENGSDIRVIAEDAIRLSDEAYLFEFRKAVRHDSANQLAGVDATALEVYTDYESFKANKKTLNVKDKIESLGKDSARPIVVLAPRAVGEAQFFGESLVIPDAEDVVLAKRARLGTTMVAVSTPEENLPVMIGLVNLSQAWEPVNGVYPIFTIPSEIASAFFSYRNADIPLYYRAAVGELRAFLSDPILTNAFVVGPPGTGKSTNTFAIIMTMCAKSDEIVWWVNPADNRAMRIIGYRIEIYTQVDLKHSRLSLFDGARMLVVDQFQATEEGTLKRLRIYEGSRSSSSPFLLIVLSSEGYDKPNERFFKRWPRFQMREWVLEDYGEALKNPAIEQALRKSFRRPNELSLNEQIKMKLFYAGVSARYMFEMSIEDIVEDVDSAWSVAGNRQDIVQLVVAKNSSSALNRLFFTTEETKAVEFTSEYVARRMADLQSADWILNTAKQYRHLIKSPGFLGHLFEAYVIQRLRRDDIELPESFMRQKGIAGIFNPSKLVFDRWLVPLKWQNPGFDAILIHHTGAIYYTAVFLQATVGKEHELTIQHFVDCLGQMTRDNQVVFNRVEIVFLAPLGHPKPLDIKKKDSYGLLMLHDSKWQHNVGAPDPVKTIYVDNSEVFVA